MHLDDRHIDELGKEARHELGHPHGIEEHENACIWRVQFGREHVLQQRRHLLHRHDRRRLLELQRHYFVQEVDNGWVALHVLARYFHDVAGEGG